MLKMVIILSSENQKEELHQFLISRKVKVFSEIQVNGFRPVYHDSDENVVDEKEAKLSPFYSTMHMVILPEVESNKLLNDLDSKNKNRSFLTPVHGYQLEIERMLN